MALALTVTVLRQSGTLQLTVLTRKRGNCDIIKVTAVVRDTLNFESVSYRNRRVIRSARLPVVHSWYWNLYVLAISVLFVADRAETSTMSSTILRPVYLRRSAGND
jgi:hypothetical protein